VVSLARRIVLTIHSSYSACGLGTQEEFWAYDRGTSPTRILLHIFLWLHPSISSEYRDNESGKSSVIIVRFDYCGHFITVHFMIYAEHRTDKGGRNIKIYPELKNVC
jgi:hypothetical protein